MIKNYLWSVSDTFTSVELPMRIENTIKNVLRQETTSLVVLGLDLPLFMRIICMFVSITQKLKVKPDIKNELSTSIFYGQLL